MNSSDFQQIAPTCPQGHDLAKTLDLASLHPESKGGYRLNSYNCDFCKASRSTVSNPCYHCTGCKYDLCSDCFQYLQNKTDLLCPGGHTLYIVKDLASAHPGSMGAYSTNKYNCNQCKQTESAEIAPTYHCKKCKFDLCQNCATARMNPNASGRKCTYGHILTEASDLASLHPHSKGGYRSNQYFCNDCKASKNAVSDHSYHCSACQYDLCPNCFKKE